MFLVASKQAVTFLKRWIGTETPFCCSSTVKPLNHLLPALHRGKELSQESIMFFWVLIRTLNQDLITKKEDRA